MRVRVLFPVAVAGAALLLAGCDQGPPQEAIEAEALACPSGSDCYDEPRPVGPGGELVVTADEFFFEIEEGTAVTGDVSFTLDNVGGTEHNIEVLGAFGLEGEVVEAGSGETAEGAAPLFPGEYTIICNIPGHRAAGMEATIEVFATEEEAESATETPTEAG